VKHLRVGKKRHRQDGRVIKMAKWSRKKLKKHFLERALDVDPEGGRDAQKCGKK